MASGRNHRGSDQNHLLLGRLTAGNTTEPNKASSSQQHVSHPWMKCCPDFFPVETEQSQSVTQIQSTCTEFHSNYIDVIVSNIDILIYL